MRTNADIFCLTCYYVLLLHSKIFLDINIRKKYTQEDIYGSIYINSTQKHIFFSVICLSLLLLTFCKPHQNKTLPSSGQNAGLFKVKLSSMLIVTDNNLVFFFSLSSQVIMVCTVRRSIMNACLLPVKTTPRAET